MSRAAVILVTSVKGGVGKSTVAADLGAALALSGKRVLLCDCDLGMRCLDLICGLEDSVLFDINDVLLRGIPAQKAAIESDNLPDLMLLAAPPPDTPEEIFRFERGALRSAGEAVGAEYILIDTPGHDGEVLRRTAGEADMALIISTQQPASVRAAQATSELLAGRGLEDRRLVINRFDAGSVPDGRRAGALSIIDGAGVRLIGIIPNDLRFEDAQTRGRLIDSPPFRKNGRPACDAAAAYANLAGRLRGESVPLFRGFRRPGENRRALGL